MLCFSQLTHHRTDVEVQWDSLCFNDEVVRLIPMSQQVCSLFIVDPYVVIAECAGEEVVYLPCDVEDVAHPRKDMIPLTTFLLAQISENMWLARSFSVKLTPQTHVEFSTL